MIYDSPSEGDYYSLKMATTSLIIGKTNISLSLAVYQG